MMRKESLTNVEIEELVNMLLTLYINNKDIRKQMDQLFTDFFEDATLARRVDALRNSIAHDLQKKSPTEIMEAVKNLLDPSKHTFEKIDDSDVVIQSPFTQVDPGRWTFDFSDPYFELFDRLYELDEIEISDIALEKELKVIINRMPEVFDASSELARMYIKQNEHQKTKLVYGKAIQVARGYIPKKFIAGKHRIEWGFMENRPFLRLLHNYALFIEQTEGLEQAIILYEEILSLNPNDNQGIRSILATIYLKVNQPVKVIGLTSDYPDDSMTELVVGNILALYQIGKKAAAKKAVKKYAQSKKNVFKEILKVTHKKPTTVRDDGLISFGGTDEAWYYWQHQGEIWKTTPGALDFLKECLQK